MNSQKPDSLEELVDQLEDAARTKDRVTLQLVMDEVGRRSFGPLLLTGGIIMTAPGVADLPVVPVILGIFILLLSVQLIFRHDDHFWLPKWMLQRNVSSETLMKTCRKWLRRPSRFIDRFLKKRMETFTGKNGTRAIAIVVSLLALATPVAEFIPFSSNVIGIGITLFGGALVANDGLVALIGWIVVAFTAALFGYQMIGGL